MIDPAFVLLLLTAVFCGVDDILIYLMVKKIGGTIGAGLKVVGFSLFAILIYMVIDLLVIYFGWLNAVYYLIAHYIIEMVAYLPMIVGLYIIFKAIRGEKK
ncbi:MAG: hypothetical protein ACP5O8_03910 [Candidatus Aenigmatarchaeota archaeon]